jgi:hypothetical protein
MSRFEYQKLPGWSELNESERWHAGYCARRLDDSQLVNEWRYGCASLIGFTSLADDERIWAWLVESLLVALTHQDKLIAFRSLIQAIHYFEDDRVLQSVRIDFRDTLQVAKNRIESFVR